MTKLEVLQELPKCDRDARREQIFLENTGTDRLTPCRVATDLQFVKSAVSAERNETRYDPNADTNVALQILIFGCRSSQPPASHSTSDVGPGGQPGLQQCPVVGFHGDNSVLRKILCRQGRVRYNFLSFVKRVKMKRKDISPRGGASCILKNSPRENAYFPAM